MAACESSRPPELLGVTPVTPMTRTRGETHRRVRNAAWHRAQGGTGVVLADDLRGPRLAEKPTPGCRFAPCFNARSGRHALRPGRYRATLIAADAAGARSK